MAVQTQIWVIKLILCKNKNNHYLCILCMHIKTWDCFNRFLGFDCFLETEKHSYTCNLVYGCLIWRLERLKLQFGLTLLAVQAVNVIFLNFLQNWHECSKIKIKDLPSNFTKILFNPVKFNQLKVRLGHIKIYGENTLKTFTKCSACNSAWSRSLPVLVTLKK